MPGSAGLLVEHDESRMSENNIYTGLSEAEFEAWFQGDHLLERLAVPGFLFGRRHQAVSGSSGYFKSSLQDIER